MGWRGLLICRLTGLGDLSGNLSFERLRTNGSVGELGMVRELTGINRMDRINQVG